MTNLDKSASSVKFLPIGAVIQELIIEGQNIVLGFSSEEPYTDSPFFGETIGRVANRIGDATIKDLNGKSYQLAKNNGKNSLHGGEKGWGKKKFSGPHPLNRNGREAVQFTYTSPDGEEGYPGTVELRVWYTAYENEEGGKKKFILETEYEAELVGKECEETAINITNHSYFNLGNQPTIEGTKVVLNADDYQTVTDDDIPLGPIDKFPGVTKGKEFTLGPIEPDIDHCFVINSNPQTVPLDTRSEELRLNISTSHPNTGIHFDVYSTEPCFQFYTGKYIDVAESKYGPARGARSGFCVEPSRYINAVNVPEWRNMVLLKQGDKYGSKIVYKAWKA